MTTQLETMLPKTLVIIAHPSLHKDSRANQKLAETATKHAATIHDLYAVYGENGVIDIEREQQLLLEHERIIFQFPVWWYSCPSLLKRWFDAVLTYGWAYGEGGNKLHGKEWGLAVTAGGSYEVYSPQGYNRYPLHELLRPFEVTASMIGTTFLPIFAVHQSRQLSEDELELQANEYAKYLTSIAPATNSLCFVGK